MTEQNTEMGLRDFRADLTNVIHRVQQGETVTILYHKRPVATISPIRPATNEVEAGS